MSHPAVQDIDKAKHGKLVDFLNTAFRSHEVGGRNIIQTQDGEFLEYVLMEEQYFLDNWLAQFAIGTPGTKNYFNHEAWSAMTDGFTKGVIVLNEEQQPTLIIRKFIDMDLGINAQAYLDHYARQAAFAQYVPDKAEADEIVNKFAEVTVAITGQNPDYDTLTAMIPYEYYLRHGVDPTVVKQVIHIRDNFTYKGQSIGEESEVLPQVEAILYKNARNEKLTQAEKNLIIEITNDGFIFNDDTNSVDTKVQEHKQEEIPDDDYDPMVD